MSITPLVKIQLAHAAKPRFDGERVPQTPTADPNFFSTFTIEHAVAVVVIRRAGYEHLMTTRSDILYDVEVGQCGRDGERCGDKECE